jgi:hypothetical protein
MMNKPGYFTVLLATALVLPNATRVGAEAPDTLAQLSPVQVTSCSVRTALLSRDPDGPAEPVAGLLSFSLKNLRLEPATEVTLRIQYGGLVETLVERGIFSTGARIDRTSDITENDPWAGARPTCAIVSVKFANAATWIPASDLPLGSG